MIQVLFATLFSSVEDLQVVPKRAMSAPEWPQDEPPKGSKMGPKRPSNSRPISYPVLPPSGPPLWGPFGASLGPSWRAFGRPDLKEWLRDATRTCSDEHLKEELRRTSLKLQNRPQVDPNLTAARLLKSPKRGQNLRKTYTFDNIAFFVAKALRWPQDGPRGVQMGAQGGPKTAPGGGQRGPRRPQDRSKPAPSRARR